jgi:ribosomal protein S21
VNNQGNLPKEICVSLALAKLKRKMNSERVFKLLKDREDNPKKSLRKRLKKKRAYFRELSMSYE